MKSPNDRTAEDVIEGEPLSPDTEMWVGVGRKLVEESISVGRDYEKFMIQFSFGAVPLYATLLRLFKGDSPITPPNEGFKIVILLAPVVLFLLSSIVFLFAYYPRSIAVLISTAEDVRRLHGKLLNSRRKMDFLGTAVFILATVTSVLVAIVRF